MAKNIKFSNLKINTNIENIEEDRNAGGPGAHSNKPKLRVIGANSPKKNYGQHVSSLSMLTTQKNEENTFQLNNDKGPHINLKVANNSNTKQRAELEIEAKCCPTTFYPKSTKVQNDNKTVLNKFLPMSTRNGKIGNTNGKSPDRLSITNTGNLIHEKGNENNFEMINVMNLLGPQGSVPLNIKSIDANIANYETSKFSAKSMTYIKAYAANTHQGIIR